MLTEDELVQQLFELDAEIEAAELRRQLNKREARAWASSGQDTSRWIQQLRDQRDDLARQIDDLPDFE